MVPLEQLVASDKAICDLGSRHRETVQSVSGVGIRASRGPFLVKEDASLYSLALWNSIIWRSRGCSQASLF